METYNLNNLLNLRTDATTKGKQPFVVADDYVRVPSARAAWELLTGDSMRRNLCRFALETLNGARWDTLTRQGVHSPRGDVHVEGTGHSMRDEAALNIGTWGDTKGIKVNRGTGLAHRTLKVGNLLAWRTNGIVYLTPYGEQELKKALGR